MPLCVLSEIYGARVVNAFRSTRAHIILLPCTIKVLYKVTLYSDIDCDVLIIVSHSAHFTKNAWADIL